MLNTLQTASLTTFLGKKTIVVLIKFHLRLSLMYDCQLAIICSDNSVVIYQLLLETTMTKFTAARQDSSRAIDMVKRVTESHEER